jgi:hypothetical protein
VFPSPGIACLLRGAETHSNIVHVPPLALDRRWYCLVGREGDRPTPLIEGKEEDLSPEFLDVEAPRCFPERILRAFLRLTAVLFPFPPSCSLLVFRNRGDASRRFERGHTEFERIGGFVWYASGGGEEELLEFWTFFWRMRIGCGCWRAASRLLVCVTLIYQFTHMATGSFLGFCLYAHVYAPIVPLPGENLHCYYDEPFWLSSSVPPPLVPRRLRLPRPACRFCHGW